MEDLHSVSSPRRILSLSKKRTLISLDRDDKAPGFGLSGEHGPKPSEVYGFVGSITTVVATVVYLIWAYVPDSWLHSVGIFYYPSRYWALAVPAYVMVSIALAWLFYIGLNFMSTPPPTSFNIMFGKLSFLYSVYFVCPPLIRCFNLCSFFSLTLVSTFLRV
ncbi:phosphatidylinositol N-acetylglucosaminyltransferase subunit P-like [Cucurbita pepo subsp. pepo]|uniref:phosphatidylinositol N-acetylglucosaminyltransferase subunit P-like n=1 Tax=Cucurbita pepo subsp. pepo TaxID=3664 RepID=UPI000C9D4575|nr:phosphatidylinositol N-acetylglucosaminyltransferase subunit P-like [Cucurbita pepo subsp. pepo]